MRKKKTMQTPEEKRQKKMAARNAALYAGFSIQNSPANNSPLGRCGGVDISNSQKIAAYNLLMNDRDN